MQVLIHLYGEITAQTLIAARLQGIVYRSMSALATLFSAMYNQAGGIIATRCGERMPTAMAQAGFCNTK